MLENGRKSWWTQQRLENQTPEERQMVGKETRASANFKRNTTNLITQQLLRTNRFLVFHKAFLRHLFVKGATSKSNTSEKHSIQ